MKYTMDTPFGELLKDPRVTPIIDSYVPGISANPMVAMISGMTLNMLVAMPQAAQLGITKPMVEQILAEANKAVGG